MLYGCKFLCYNILSICFVVHRFKREEITVSKKAVKLLEPNMKLYFLIAVIFCVVTLWCELWLGIAEAGVIALMYVYFHRTTQKRRENIQRYIDDRTADMANAGKASVLTAPFAMMVFRPDTQ